MPTDKEPDNRNITIVHINNVLLPIERLDENHLRSPSRAYIHVCLVSEYLPTCCLGGWAGVRATRRYPTRVTRTRAHAHDHAITNAPGDCNAVSTQQQCAFKLCACVCGTFFECLPQTHAHNLNTHGTGELMDPDTRLPSAHARRGAEK